MDGLTIATKEGEGEAKVLPSSGEAPYDIWQKSNIQRKKQLDAKNKEIRANQISKLKDLEDISDIAIKGDVSHLEYLTKQKDALYKDAADYLYKTEGKGDVKRQFYERVNALKKDNDFSEQVKQYRSQAQQDINLHYDKLDPKSIQEFKDFLKKPPQEQYSHILEKGGFPELKAKPEVYNYDEMIGKLNVKPKEFTTEVDKSGAPLKKDGFIVTKAGTYYDKNDVDVIASRFVSSGEGDNPRNPAAAQLLSDKRKELQDDPNFIILSPDEQNRVIKKTAEDYVKMGIISRGGTESSTKLKKEGTSRDYSLSGNVYSNNKWNFTLSENKKRVYLEGVDPSENKPIVFSTNEGTIEGKPVYWRMVGIGAQERPELVVEVPKKDEEGKVVGVEEVGVDYRYSAPKMEAVTGVSFGDVKKAFGMDQGSTPATNVVTEKSKTPKKGDTMKTREGLAEFDGKKWVLKK